MRRPTMYQNPDGARGSGLSDEDLDRLGEQYGREVYRQAGGRADVGCYPNRVLKAVAVSRRESVWVVEGLETEAYIRHQGFPDVRLTEAGKHWVEALSSHTDTPAGPPTEWGGGRPRSYVREAEPPRYPRMGRSRRGPRRPAN